MELVNELTHVHRLARELKSRLGSGSDDLCRSLAHEILASIERAISMASLNACPDYLGAAAGSPSSYSSEPPPFKADRRKKCVRMSKCTSQVTLGSGPAAAGPLDDGHSWRKYGQKAILGATHPRGYYRCTHRNTQGCLAMKQVQRSDDNPAAFHVTYRGTHTCRPSPSPAAGHDSQLLLSFQANLKVETDGLDSQHHQGPYPSSLFFPPTPADDRFKRSFADAFVSPATPESGFTEMVSGATSPDNSCNLDLDFLLQSSAELDAEFSFDDLSFFA